MTKSITTSPTDLVVTLNDLTVSAGYQGALVDAGLDSLEALMAVQGDSLDKPGLDGWRQRVRLTLTVNGKEETYYLKRFTHPPRKIQREIRRCKMPTISTVAGLEWLRMWQLDGAGINGPKPIALGEVWEDGTELCSAVLMKSVAGQSLEAWCRQWNTKGPAQIGVLIDPLAELIRQFHKQGFVHRDLYLAHLFFDPTSPVYDAISMIDLQRIIEPDRHRTRWIVKDLASLNFSAPEPLVSRTSRLRWLRKYAGVRKLGRAERQLAYMVIGKTQQIARHDRRRNVRLGNALKDDS